MDPLASAAGVADHALMIDCTTFEVTTYPVPADVVEVIVIHSGQERALSASAYAKRTVQCKQAEAAIGGPLRTASHDDIDAIADPVVRARGHPRGDCERPSPGVRVGPGPWRVALRPRP